jgi:hypothetical protein
MVASVWTAELELTPPEVLGLRLRPLQLGHLRLLHAVGSPFLLPDAKRSCGDLALAVFICANDPLVVTAMEMANREEAFREWGALVSTEDFEAAARLFDGFVADWCVEPEQWTAVGTSRRKPGAPWWQLVQVALCSKMGVTREAAWRMPVPEALRTYAALGELNGDVEIVSDEERAALATQIVQPIDPDRPLAEQVAEVKRKAAGHGV